MKQAFLIIAHGDFCLLQRLILALECQEVDFFVHIDAKVKSLPALYVTGQSSLTVIKDRVDTRWGDYSQITTELKILEESYFKGKYSHYHIISGTHFPIKPVNEIISFYNKLNGKTVLCGLCQSAPIQEMLKLRRYNLFTKRLAYGSDSSKAMFQKLWRLSHDVQKVMVVKRHKETSFYKASNWASFSEEAVEYLLKERTQIERLFHWTFCGDEYFAPTLLKMSPLAESIVSIDELLKQEMGDANPRVYTIYDYEEIVSSGCLFARKFSDSHLDVVELISDYIRR